MKGKLANGVGSQYSSHYLGTMEQHRERSSVPIVLPSGVEEIKNEGTQLHQNFLLSSPDTGKQNPTYTGLN